MSMEQNNVGEGLGRDPCSGGVKTGYGEGHSLQRERQTAGVKTQDQSREGGGDEVRNGAMKVKRGTWLSGGVTSSDFP